MVKISLIDLWILKFELYIKVKRRYCQSFVISIINKLFNFYLKFVTVVSILKNNCTFGIKL